MIPALESNRPEHQRKGIEVFSQLYSIPLVRSTIDMWAKQHEKIRFGAFCRAVMYHSRYLMDRFQKRRTRQLRLQQQQQKDEGGSEEPNPEEAEEPKVDQETLCGDTQYTKKAPKTTSRVPVWNYHALGERLAQMWILMPPQYKQKLTSSNKT